MWADMSEIITVNLPSQPARVQRGGEGPPLLLLHSEANTSAWSEFHERLAANFEVFAPIHPGFGGEETPDWLVDMTDLAFHYKDLLKHLEVDHPIVVGTSIGAWIASDLAIHFSSLIKGLVLFGPMGLRPTEPLPDLFIMQLPEAFSYLANSLDGSQVDPMTGDADLATAVWTDLATQARLMWKRSYDPRLAMRAHHADCPIMVAVGDQDRLTPSSYAERYAELFDASFTTSAGAGHLVPLDEPAAAAALVNSFYLTLEK
jgi:pimeloyl-ACP methyl ester carboxylesterase